MHGTATAFVIALLCWDSALAHTHGQNGMDMNMDGSMALSMGSMLPYLHFTPGDNLWFIGWVPKSKGAMVGACIGLFLLALTERWIAACRAAMEVHWAKRSLSKLISMRPAPPFIRAHDITRGVMHAGQTALGFAFMLVVMCVSLFQLGCTVCFVYTCLVIRTFQASFILAIVVGLGAGEVLFGRFIHDIARLHTE
jgi:hypothetical protein